jgi:hypothetical protein
VDTDEHDTLSASELDRIEKAIFEVARQQRGKRVPVSLPFPDFWDRAVHLVIHLEQEADRMRRDGVGSARLSTGVRRMANIRTQIRNLANLRLNALTSHAVIGSLLEEGGSRGNGNSIEWSRMDPKERAFHSEISRGVDRFRAQTSWDVLMGIEESSGEEAVGVPDLNRFEDEEELDGLAPFPEPSPEEEVEWDDPEMDEEDRIRTIDDGYPEAPLNPASQDVKHDLVKIRIIEDSDDPIINEDGDEIRIVEGEFHLCSQTMSETLISIGLAELAEV